MRKFFTFIAAAAVTFSSLALNVRNNQLTTNKTLKTEISISKDVKKEAKFAKRVPIQRTITTTKAPQQRSTITKAEPNTTSRKMRVMKARKVDGNPSVEGLWTFQLGDWYNGPQSLGSINVTFTATDEDGIIIFEESNGYYLPFAGVYDAVESTISFPKLGIGMVETTDGGSYYTYQEPFEYNWDTEKIDDIEALIGQFNSAAGTMTFPSDQGIGWGAYASQSSTERLGYFGLYDFEGAKLQGGGNTGGGNTGDNGSLEGSWVFTFGDYYLSNATQSSFNATFECTYDAEYDEYEFADPTGYELPFYAEFDATTNLLSIPAMYIGSTGQYYVSQEPFEFTGSDLQYLQALTATFNPSAATLTFSPETGIEWGAYTSMDTDGYVGAFSMYDFEQAVKSGGGGGTTPEPGDEGAVKSIENLTDTKVEYFNLQGVRVTNPQAGQILIVRKGNETTKSIMK